MRFIPFPNENKIKKFLIPYNPTYISSVNFNTSIELMGNLFCKISFSSIRPSKLMFLQKMIDFRDRPR